MSASDSFAFCSEANIHRHLDTRKNLSGRSDGCLIKRTFQNQTMNEPESNVFPHPAKYLDRRFLRVSTYE